MKKIILMLTLAALVCSGCNSVSEQAAAEAAQTASAETAETEAAVTTAASTPAETSAQETSKKPETQEKPETTAAEKPQETGLPEINWEECVPLLPEADEAAMADEALVKEIKEAFDRADKLVNLMNGYAGAIELGDVYHVSADILFNEDEGEYHLVTDPLITDEASLLKLYDDTFSKNYLSNYDIKDLLFGTHELYFYDGTSVPFFLTVDGNLLFYSTYIGVPARFGSAIITYADDNTVEAVASGSCLAIDNWYIKTVRFVKEGGAWKVDSLDTKYADYMGTNLNKLIGREKTEILSKIGGCVEYVYRSDGQINYFSGGDNGSHNEYYEVEPFMTTDEMKEFLRGVFSPELAEQYISEYVGNFYSKYNSDGHKLYMLININKQSFGSYDIVNSGRTTESGGQGNTFKSFNVIPWDDGSGEITTVSVKLMNTPVGLRIGSKLPTKFLPVKEPE